MGHREDIASIVTTIQEPQFIFNKPQVDDASDLNRLGMEKGDNSEIVALLRRLGVKVEHTGNYGGVDIRGCIRGVEVIIQCKNYKEEKPIDEALTQPKNHDAISIVVIPDERRFTKDVIDRAEKSVFPVIQTDKTHLSLCILYLVIDQLQDRSFEFSFYHDLANNH
ncbi:13503_t:CDS:2 [Gigaspora margarita]|uniref:13503_t:CDS:1 n=1 Tax=Gigaspora margarita TaxID=4874 RepID=A0ABM8W6Y2_GIGMA|nr:13503_t:CDS:2 [Gigaspora margarita]